MHPMTTEYPCGKWWRPCPTTTTTVPPTTTTTVVTVDTAPPPLPSTGVDTPLGALGLAAILAGVALVRLTRRPVRP